MATIRSAISIYDGMTGPLQKMYRAVTTLTGAFEGVQDVSSNAVDTTKLQEARDLAARSAAEFDEMADSIRQADQTQNEFNRSVREGATVTDGLISKVRGVVAAVGGLAAMKKAMNLSDQLSSTKARLTLMVDDGGSVAALEDKIRASAARSRASYLDTAAAVSKLGLMARDAFDNNDEVIAFTELINKQFVISGATPSEQANAMLQLTQAMASGVLRGDELNSIFEQAPNLIQTIADYMGRPVGEIRDLASEGLITADIVKNAMFSAADKINEQFDTIPMTWGQVFSRGGNYMLTALQPSLDKLSAAAKYVQDNWSRFEPIFTGIGNAAVVLITVLGAIAMGALAVSDIFAENWPWIEPIVWGLVGAFTAYYGTLLIYNTIQGITNTLQAISAAHSALKAGATLAEAAATTTATGAQVGLNAALLACPIFWIVIGVIALIAAIVAVVRATNLWGAQTHSVVGTITGLIAAAAAFIGNLFVALINVGIDNFVALWNFIGSFANFFANVFNDPVGSIVRLFADMADTVLSVLESLASAIDTVFGSNLSGSVAGWRNSLKGLVDANFGKGEEVWKKIDSADLHLGRFEYSAAFDAGAAWGDGIADKIGGLFDFSTPDFDTSSTLDGIAANIAGSAVSGADTAANTAAMRDSLDYMEEDLAYMIDIAEREAINRFTTAEIRLEQNNTNYVDSETDLDGVMDVWAADFAERLAVSIE